jgi:hypothetical protein
MREEAWSWEGIHGDIAMCSFSIASPLRRYVTSFYPNPALGCIENRLDPSLVIWAEPVG